jgi:hypothetical protein
MDKKLWRFIACCLSGESPKNLFTASEFISDADAGANNSIFNVYYQNEWYRYDSEPEWSCVAMVSAKYPKEARWVVVGIGSGGAVWEMYPKGPSERYSKIDDRIGFTNLAVIEHKIYTCGMGRICFYRDASGLWVDISAPRPKSMDEVIGFMSMAGLSERLFYAVGWRGEIWVRVNDVWERQDSPTSENLNAVAIGVDGLVYCVGDHGVMLKGKVGMWEVVETNIGSNLLDVCVYNGEVFACSDFEVFRLSENGLSNDFLEGGGDMPKTCLRLVSDEEGYLFSVGPSDVFARRDKRWERIV